MNRQNDVDNSIKLNYNYNMKSGIYKITNICNGKIYIGLSKNLTRRFSWHKYNLRNGCHDNSHLQRAWDKYGENSFLFEIIEECSVDKLSEKEKYWIDFYGGFESDKLYNLRDGGETGNTLSKEVINKIRQKNLGKPCFWKGKHLPKEMIEKIRMAQKGKKLSPEHREKAVSTLKKYWNGKPGYWTGKTITEEHRENLKKAHLGQKSWNKGNKGMISEETRKKLRESHLGHRHPEEVKRKISEGHKGKFVGEETRKKLSEANKGQRRYWIYKGKKSTTVPLEKIEFYLSKGWKRGKGENKRIWINNGLISKMVFEKDLYQYDLKIWKRGRIFHER